MPEKKKIITPRGKWVYIKPVESEGRTTDQGLLIPETEEEQQKAQGIVQGVGDEVKDIKKGDTVIYGAYAGENLKIHEGGKDIEYKLLLDEDIIAFVK